MPSLKDLRNRIASVKATRKITKAMQMVAAAKLRRAQEAATAARPYAERMDKILANLGSRASRETASPLLVGNGKDQTHLLVVMTAERGLCGGFNSNIAKLARADAQRLMSIGKTVKTKEYSGKVTRLNFLQQRIALKVEDDREVEVDLDEIIK